MKLNELTQILDTVNIGLVILDRDLNVQYWNRWMSIHSIIAADTIIGTPLFEHYPGLNTRHFQKNCKVVLSFGNFAFFSQKLHRFLFPFKPESSIGSRFENMQQSCTMGPLRSEDNSISGIFLTVQDVTELATYEQKLIELNTKDALTGVYNRRYMETKLKEEFDRHSRYQRPLSILMIDIDFFKKVNDTYGHQGGDLVLKAVASSVMTHIRKTDTFARYGGEEFCCMLPETAPEAAEIVAENIRRQIEAMTNEFEGKTIKVTISLGISNITDGDSIDSMIKRADDALYEAKHSGRNRFVRF